MMRLQLRTRLPVILADTNTSNNELQIYINSIFKKFTLDNLDVLNKIVKVVEKKEPNDIKMFIAIISQRLYFTIREQIELYKELEHIILKFLQWEYQYFFKIESYITHHILSDTIDNKNISSEVKQTVIDLMNNTQDLRGRNIAKPVTTTIIKVEGTSSRPDISFVDKKEVNTNLQQDGIVEDINSIMNNITDISSLSPEKLLSLLQEKGIVKKEC